MENKASFSSLSKIMITYSSPKYNNLSKKIIEILKFNNIDTFDSESTIPENVLSTITLLVQECIIPSDKFLTEKCPKCGKNHLKLFNSTYSRNVILKINNILIKVKLVVPRLICENCSSTHAVLPDFCVPLKKYSKDAIIEIVNLAIEKGTEEVAATLNIDSKQVRRFINVVRSAICNLSVLAYKLKVTMEFILYKLKDLYRLIKQIPNITEKYFEEFRTIFLYEKKRRELYIEYSKLST